MKKKDTKKTTKHSTGERPKSIVFEWYDQIGTGKKLPLSDEFIEKLCDELIDWAFNDENALTLGDFFRPRRIAIATYTSWRERYPMFGAAYLEAMEAIGDRRTNGSLKRKFDSTTWAKTARLFNRAMDKQWHADQEFVAKLKLDNDSNETKYIIIKDFPDAKSEQ